MIRRWYWPVLLSLLTSCAILPGGKPARESNVYLLESRIAQSPADLQTGCHVLIVNPPENAPAQNGSQMLYQRTPNKIERFAFSRWAASPAAMLEPLLLAALRSGDNYSAVLSSPAPIGGDLRIESDGLWLIQRFDGDRSRVELRMSSRLYSPRQRRLMATRDFSYAEAADNATPVAGVAAADRAVGRLLSDFSAFVAEAARQLDNNCKVEN